MDLRHSIVCNRRRLVSVKLYLNRRRFTVVVAKCLGAHFFGTYCRYLVPDTILAGTGFEKWPDIWPTETRMISGTSLVCKMGMMHQIHLTTIQLHLPAVFATLQNAWTIKGWFGI